jgi:hypothetical protein
MPETAIYKNGNSCSGEMKGVVKRVAPEIEAIEVILFHYL